MAARIPFRPPFATLFPPGGRPANGPEIRAGQAVYAFRPKIRPKSERNPVEINFEWFKFGEVRKLNGQSNGVRGYHSPQFCCFFGCFSGMIMARIECEGCGQSPSTDSVGSARKGGPAITFLMDIRYDRVLRNTATNLDVRKGQSTAKLVAVLGYYKTGEWVIISPGNRFALKP